MTLAKIITAGIAGTTAMTIFSYYLSRKQAQNFREPQLLAELIIKRIPSTGELGALMSGWILHYLVGVFFSGVYTCVPGGNPGRPVVVKFVLTGGLTGIIAIAGWRTLLQLHPDPPKLDRPRFYGQLITAHGIFGVVTLLILNANRIFVIGSKYKK